MLVTLTSLTPTSSQNLMVEISVSCGDCTSTDMILEGDVVHVLCAISRQLQTGETVFIEQTTKDKNNVKWSRDKDLILPNNDNNPFVTVQTSIDGTVLYILTFTAVNRSHSGLYQCNVYQLNGNPVFLGSDSTDIDILYLPNESFPICTYNDTLDLEIGKAITFTCNSEDAHPQISLQWTQDNSKAGIEQEITSKNGTVKSSVVLTPSMATNGTTFICTLSSPLFKTFPEQLKLLGLNRSSCTIGPLNVKASPFYILKDTHPEAYPPIFGLRFPVFVISATGVGTFIFLAFILLIIYACYSYRCVCVISRKRVSISGPGGRRGNYDLTRSRGSMKEATDIWTEKRPSRVAPPPPVQTPRQTNLLAISELPEGHGIAMNSYPDEPMDSYPPPPEEWLTHSQDEYEADNTANYSEVHYHNTADVMPKHLETPSDTTDTAFLINVSGDIANDSEDQEPQGVINHAYDIEDEEPQQDITNHAYIEEIIYHNSNYFEPTPDRTLSMDNTEPSASDENFTDIPVDQNASPMKHRGSKTLPRPPHDFPEYAKPHKIKLKRSSSLPSSDKPDSMEKPTKPSKPSFEPPPPPLPSSNASKQGSDETEPDHVKVKIGPSIDAAGYATVSH